MAIVVSSFTALGGGVWAATTSNGLCLNVVANKYPGGSSLTRNFAVQVYTEGDDILHEASDFESYGAAEEYACIYAREIG